jgi:hypothetical protein
MCLKFSLKTHCIIIIMSGSQILIQFKNSLVSFMDELIDSFPQEPDLIIFRIFLKDQIPIEDVMSKFIYSINKNDGLTKKNIKDRNDDVFLKNEIFDNFIKAKAKTFTFQKLWQSENLDDEEKKTVWRWIDSFVILSERYTKIKSENLS